MKVLFLLPPSEGKTPGGNIPKTSTYYSFSQPLDIAEGASEKDLKCTGKRYTEAKNLNQTLLSQLSLPAIERYTGVMYRAIDYSNMNDGGKTFFDTHFLIASGMYGLVTPRDTIPNYKLPIETKGLSHFWKNQITDSLNSSGVDYIIDLLPLAYKKMIDIKNLDIPFVSINFLQEKDEKITKIAHGVKKIKGEWIKNICENQILDYNDFGGEVIKRNNAHIDINILH